MDGLIALVGLVCLVGTAICGMCEAPRGMWVFGLLTSIFAIMFPFALAAHPEPLLDTLSAVFRPELVQPLANAWILIILISGVGGFITCLYQAIVWFVGNRKKAEELRENIAANAKRRSPASRKEYD